MAKFTQLDKQSLIERVVKELIIDDIALGINHKTHLYNEKVSERAEKIVNSAITSYIKEINTPIAWVGSISCSISNREFKADSAAFCAAKNEYYATSQCSRKPFFPEFLLDALGFL